MDSDSDGAGPLQDYFCVTIDGMTFSVAYDASQSGAYHYTRLAGAPGGPAIGYGFTSGTSDQRRRTTAEHIHAIRSFVEMVDPVTGYIEHGPDDRGPDVHADEETASRQVDPQNGH